MSEECNHDWIPYRLFGIKTPELTGVDSHFKVSKVKCIKCGEIKEID